MARAMASRWFCPSDSEPPRSRSGQSSPPGRPRTKSSAQAARSGCYQSPQPFHPHITLWRDARRAVPIPAPGFRWTFPVNEFVLYESSFSRGRTRYTALERYPFDKES